MKTVVGFEQMTVNIGVHVSVGINVFFFFFSGYIPRSRSYGSSVFIF